MIVFLLVILGDIARAPWGGVAEDVTGESIVGIGALRADANINAREFEIEFGKTRKLLVGEIGSVGEGDQSTVGGVVNFEAL